MAYHRIAFKDSLIHHIDIIYEHKVQGFIFIKIIVQHHDKQFSSGDADVGNVS